jgi:hypothetical protein
MQVINKKWGERDDTIQRITRLEETKLTDQQILNAIENARKRNKRKVVKKVN